MNICPQMCMFLECWSPSIIFIIVLFLSYDNHSYHILKTPKKLDNHMPPKNETAKSTSVLISGEVIWHSCLYGISVLKRTHKNIPIEETL